LIEDMRGKTIIVTGANTGIGKRTAANLAKMGARVILACRSLERAEQAMKELENERVAAHHNNLFSRQGSFEVELLDLSSLESVKQFATRIEQKLSTTTDVGLDVLVCNAGLNSRNTMTKDGFGNTFQCNYLGHFALILLLLPMLRKRVRDGRKPRIVLLGSVMHNWGVSRVDTHAMVDNSMSYADSKMCMSLLGHHLRSRESANGIFTIVVNPGAVQSDIWRWMPKTMRFIFNLVTGALILDSDLGSATSVAAASSETLLQKQNAKINYLTPYRNFFGLHIPFDMLGPFAGVRPGHLRLPVHPEIAGRKMWDLSVHLIESKSSIRFSNEKD